MATPPPVEPHRVSLWPDSAPCELLFPNGPYLEIYRPLAPEPSPQATVLICPGGGYAWHSPYECLWAELIRSFGLGAAVLHYRLSPGVYPAPYADATRAIRLLKTRGTEWGVSGAHLALMGGSAGGHLAALAAVRPDWYRDPLDDLANDVSATVERLILAYPVISTVAACRYENLNRVFPSSMSIADLAEYSPELHIDATAPPTFLVHAAGDKVVSVENSLLFARQCWQAGVPAELHVFPDDGHGCTFQYQPDISWRWRTLLQQWLTGWTPTWR